MTELYRANESVESSRHDTRDAQAFAGVIRLHDLDNSQHGWRSRQTNPSQVDETTTLNQVAFRFEQDEPLPVTLSYEILKLESAPQQFALIDTMAPEQIEVFRAFHVSVQPYDDEFRADFLDANLSAFGATRNEAIWNLKDIIASTFWTLLDHEDGRLGKGLARQLAVLKSFMRNLM